ncbi:MAG: hypothetical protein MJH10_11040 [Epibacterium sp.]|nr:hypothetical protein [Epibacterium sp.]NQX74081.1 hypothetical protein [Epibacterium sp.]
MVKRSSKRSEKKARNNASKRYSPKGYSDQNEFLYDMRQAFSVDITADEANRNAALEDSLFVAGEQWDDTIKQRRIREKKPVLTINRLPAFIGQLVGNRRMNETQIRVTPDVGGTKPAAQLRQGIIRSIEKTSRADRAYNNAFQNSTICGIGNFGVTIDYAFDDVFERDARIYTIPNPLAVVWDANSVEPTGADAERCFVIEEVDKDDFDKVYPDAATGDLEYDSGISQNFGDGWYEEGKIRVVHYWEMQYEERTLVLMRNGDVNDVTDMSSNELREIFPNIVLDETTGEPYMRKSLRSKAVCHICTGKQILEGPIELPIKRLPVFRVPGWEIDTAYNRQRFGVVRFAKDPQRMHNYWRSVIVEKLMLTPKAPWVASAEAVEGRENQWRNAHLSNDTLLIYNGSAGQVPTRTEPAQLESALIQEASMASQDMKDVTNIHEAALGMTSNEVSGKAILARQKVGEIGSVIYLDNLDMAIEECGKVLNDLIPVLYDTHRVVKVIDVDEFGTEQERLAVINGEVEEEPDITVGKYSVTVHTGPSQVTRRLEAAEGMLNMVNAMPQFMQVAAPEIVEAQDWPGAGKIAKRLRKQLGLADPEDMTPEEQQAAQAAAQAAQREQQMKDAAFAAELAEKQAKTVEMNARAAKARAEIQKMVMDTIIDLQRLQNETDRVELDAIEVAARIESIDIQDGATVIGIARQILEMETTPPPGMQQMLTSQGVPNV